MCNWFYLLYFSAQKRQFLYYITVYVGNCSLWFQKQIASIFQRHHLVIKPVYTSKKKTDQFCIKSKCLEVFDANIIYRYTYTADQSISYIRETSRQVYQIFSDHWGIDKNNAIFDHLFSCKRSQNSNIVQTLKFWNDVNILESILIEDERPNLNTQMKLN